MNRHLLVVASVLFTGCLASYCYSRGRLTRTVRLPANSLTIPSQLVRPLLTYHAPAAMKKKQ